MRSPLRSPDRYLAGTSQVPGDVGTQTPLRVLSDGREKPGLFPDWPHALIFAGLILGMVVGLALLLWWIF